MAKRRRKTSARPTARRKATTTRRHRNPTVYSSSRRTTRVTRSRRRVSRRRNPATGSLISQAIGLAGGITAVGLAQAFVPPIGGVSPIAIAGRQAATGYLLGLGMEKFGVLRSYAKEVQLAGFALGVGTLINAFLLPTLTGFLRPAPKAENSNGVQGIGYYRPGMQPYGAYAPRGLNGIAAWAPGQQPFGDYAAVAVA